MILPVTKLLVVKRFIILRARVSQSIVVWMISLNQHSSRSITTTSTPRDLRDELKRSFRRSEIRQSQTRINRNHTNQSHIRKIMTLRQHLRADKRIDAARAEVNQRLLKHLSPRRSITIYSCDTQGREQQLEHLLELLRAFAHVVNVFLPTRRANARH